MRHVAKNHKFGKAQTISQLKLIKIYSKIGGNSDLNFGIWVSGRRRYKTVSQSIFRVLPNRAENSQKDFGVSCLPGQILSFG